MIRKKLSMTEHAVDTLTKMEYRVESDDFIFQFRKSYYSNGIYLYLKIRERKTFFFIPYTKVTHKLVANSWHGGNMHFFSSNDPSYDVLAPLMKDAQDYYEAIEVKLQKERKTRFDYEQEQLALAIERATKQRKS